MSTYYLGLSVTYHDSALAIVNEDGDILFAEATERFLQNKRALNCEPDQLFRITELLSRYCLKPKKFVIATNWRKKRPLYENIVKRLGVLSATGLTKTGIRKLHSPLPNYKLHHMMACQRGSIERAGLNFVRIIREHYPNCTISFKDYDHHLTHAAMACYGSPFEESACAVIDSYGEHGAMAFYRYQNRKLESLHEAKGLGHVSLGLYYMKITELCGFDWLKGEEWKVMGLAAYGKLNPKLYELLSGLFVVNGLDCKHQSGGFFHKLKKLDEFAAAPGGPPQAMADVAYTGQVFFADLVTQLLHNLQNQIKSNQLAFAGGCALNSSFNGQITRRTPFQQVHIPSAPGDDGCALGAAWLACREDHPQKTYTPKPQLPFTGSTIQDDALERLLRFNRSLNIQYLPNSICEDTARLLSIGKLVAWVQGRAEFGPRALGNRSILADPRSAVTQDLINERIKFREMFRPFAPSILADHAASVFR